MSIYKLSTPSFTYMLKNDQYTPTNKILIAMVGLPAQGKSYFGNRLESKGFLNHGGKNSMKVKVFNAGSKRRSDQGTKPTAEWFAKQKDQKEIIAMETLDDSIKWLSSNKNNNCAIFDATNSTLKRRKNIYNLLEKHKTIDLIFVEIVCPNKKIRDLNILHKIASSPNYMNMDPIQAKRDFEKRVSIYKKDFVSIVNNREEKYKYIQLIVPKCLGKSKGTIVCNNISPFHWIVKYCESIPGFLKSDEKVKKISSYK